MSSRRKEPSVFRSWACHPKSCQVSMSTGFTTSCRRPASTGSRLERTIFEAHVMPFYSDLTKPKSTVRFILQVYIVQVSPTHSCWCRPGGHCKISVQMSARLSAFLEAFAITQVWTSTSDLIFIFTVTTEPAPADRFVYQVALRFCTNPRRSLCAGIKTNTKQAQKTCTQHSLRHVTLPD